MPGYSNLLLPLIAPLAPANDEALLTAERSANLRCSVHLEGTLPQPVSSLGACALGGWLYVLGGHLGKPHDYAREHQSPHFLRLNLADLKTWEVLPELERGVQSVALVACRSELYRIGGMLAQNARGEAMQLESSPLFARLDPANATWQPLAPLPKGRSSHAAAALGAHIYVVGGWEVAGPLGRQSRFCDESWVFDVEHPDRGWRSIATPFQRRGLGLAALERALVAIGGMDEDGEATGRVDVLDVESGAWTRGPDFPDTGFGVSAAGADGRVVACGSTGRVWTWAPGEASWVLRGDLLFPRIFHQLVASRPGECIAIGGVAGGEHVGAVERIRIAGNPGAAVAGHVLTPAPCSARNRQAALLVGDELYLFGGNKSTGQHDFAPENFLDEGWKLDLRKLVWSRTAALPVRRQTLQAASVDGKTLWAAGGFGHDGAKLRTFAEVYVYEREEDRWSERKGLSVPLSQFGLVEHGGALWALGGLDYVKGRGEGEDFRHSLDVLRKDLADEGGFQPTGIQLPRPRRAFGCAVLEGRAYLIGGLADGFEPVAECDVVDLVRSTWTSMPPPARPRISPELVALGGKLYLAGGASLDEHGESRPERSLEVFDPASGTWSTLLEELPIQPAHMRLFAHRGRLLAFSTQREGEGVAELCWIEPN